MNQVASSLNSSYFYILHSESIVFTWSGNLTTSDYHELVERMLDLIKVCYVPRYLNVKNSNSPNKHQNFLFLKLTNMSMLNNFISLHVRYDKEIFKSLFDKHSYKCLKILTKITYT